MGADVSLMSFRLPGYQFEKGRLQRVLVEKTGDPLLPGGGSGDFPEGTGVVLQSGGNAVLVSVFHGEKSAFRGWSPRRPRGSLCPAGRGARPPTAPVPGPRGGGSRCIPPYPGMMPSLPSGWPRLAFSVTIR